MSVRRASRWIAVVAVAILLTMFPEGARASSAQEGALQISHDGVTFAAADSASLFDEIQLVVPGDRLTETLWARSSAPTAGRLGVELTDVVADGAALAGAMTIAVTVDGIDVGSVVLGDAEDGCLVIADSTLLRPGQTARVDAELTVAATLGDGSLPGGQDESVRFRMQLTLTDAVMPERPPGSCTTGVPPVSTPVPPPGELPHTGTASVALFALLAAAAVGAGVGLLRSRRSS